MEAENDEVTKGHDNSFSLLNTIAFTLSVSAVVAVAGYLGYPVIVNLLERVYLWFDWFHLVLQNIFIIFIILNALIGSIYFIFLKTTEKNKPDRDLYDEYIAAAPSVVRPFAPMEVGDFGGGYNDNSSYQESTVPPFQAVVNTVEEYNCYDRVVTETNSKSYRKTTRSEKKMKKKKMRLTVEDRRTGSERVMKTASWRSQGIDELSSEEFRMTVETFIMKNKCYWQNGVDDHWRNGVSQLQNGVTDHLKNGVPRLQNVVDQWQNGVPQLQNGGADQWQPEYDGTGLHRRLVGGSGSTGSDGPYLAISN